MSVPRVNWQAIALLNILVTLGAITQTSGGYWDVTRHIMTRPSPPSRVDLSPPNFVTSYVHESEKATRWKLSTISSSPGLIVFCSIAPKVLRKRSPWPTTRIMKSPCPKTPFVNPCHFMSSSTEVDEATYDDFWRERPHLSRRESSVFFVRLNSLSCTRTNPLFCDIQNRLRTDHFRLCEIFNPQYFNTAPISPPFRGRGFLTVGEALFLRDARTWLGDNRETERVSSTQGTVQTLKLAAVAVAFDQLDYAIEICRHFENTSLVSLDTLARESNVKYISMLGICAGPRIQPIVTTPFLLGTPRKSSLVG